ncbi:xylitol dehydrogenase [Microdochium trichocladiopsis]|uniref:D-xylulose reductase n=1 Tax=Microdochium trichocladiopsis TaxID=1682393 RepID=A0A9P9BI77_9PEZI|nr:xylitol dehydrogenase [Microdochium trichocladiopsis]KAH7014085.1 xylitol dehydrogenase [Microdochium trichocladiopsis]
MTLPESNRACVWVGARKVEVQQRPVKPVGANDVLVKIISTGICGSDCHNYESDKVSRQLVLGHESSGIIEQVGPSVTDRTVGQRVAVEPGFACMDCEFCLRGNPNTCANLRYCGMDPTDGTLCQYVTCRASMTVPIPDRISWEEAGSIQPLAIAVQLGRRANLGAHQSLAILGCGPLGLLILAVARAYGVKKIVMFDVEQSRVDFAVKYGADAGLVPPAREQSKESLAFAQEYATKVIKEHGMSNGFDVTVEASGAEICAQMALCLLKNGGTCIQAGLGKPLTSVPLFMLTARELTIKDAIDLLARGKVDLKPLITSTFPLTKCAEAFEAQHARKDIKIIIMNQE